MKQITIWYMITDDGNKKLNHIENGWAVGDYPKPKSKDFVNQKAWKNMKWEGKYGYLTDDFKVVK